MQSDPAMSAEFSLDDTQIDSALHGFTIPPRPQVVVDLQMEQVMPDPDMGTIVRLISQDVGIAGAILKIVNSAKFGLRREVKSVQHAVSMLGIDSIVNLATTLAMRRELSGDQVDALNRFWDSAGDVAAVSRLIAQQVELENEDECYTLGLFHDCGVPLMMTKFNNYQDVLEAAYAGCTDRRVVDIENEHLGTNHAVLGYYVSKSWKLPSEFSDAIRAHHNVQEVFGNGVPEESERNTLLAVLKLAGHLCGLHKVLAGQEHDHEWDLGGNGVLGYLGMVDHDVQNLRDTCEEQGIGTF